MKDFTTMKSLLRSWGLKLAAAAFWLLVWQLIYLAVAQEILLVSPVQVFFRLFSLLNQTLFWRSVAASVGRVLLGYLAALAVGLILGSATAASRILYTLFRPLLEVVRATPVASFIILALLWLANDYLPAFIAFLMVLPMVWANTYTGIRQTSPQLLEMARVFHLGPLKTLRHIYYPSVLPHFMNACTVGLGFAWKSVIATEVMAPPRIAMGKQIYHSKIYLETVDLFAWTVAVIILSVLLEKITVSGLKRLSGRLSASVAATRGEGDNGGHPS